MGLVADEPSNDEGCVDERDDGILLDEEEVEALLSDIAEARVDHEYGVEEFDGFVAEVFGFDHDDSAGPGL